MPPFSNSSELLLRPYLEIFGGHSGGAEISLGGSHPAPPPGTAPVSGYRKNFMTISQRFKNYRVDKQTNKQTHKPTVLKTTHLASSNNYLSTCRPRLSCCREIFGHFLLHRFSFLFLPRAQYSEVVLFSVVYICMRVCVCVCKRGNSKFSFHFP